MGIFGFKTKYDITPKPEALKTLVTNYSDVDVVKMNAKLVVPDGYFFVIGKRGKALDLFDVGEYFLNTSALPYMCRKFNIDRVKGGKSQDKIPADFYFLNKSLWGGMFKTHRKATMGTKAYGMYGVKVKGVFSYKIIEPREFMQSLLNEFDYIRTGEAEDIVNSWVGDEILSELEHKNFMINDIVSNSAIVVDCLKTRISKLFSTAGLELVDFKIVKYELPKEYQEASDTVLKMQELGAAQSQSDFAETTETPAEETPELIDNNTSPKDDLDEIMSDIQAAKDLLKEFNIGVEEDFQDSTPQQEEIKLDEQYVLEDLIEEKPLNMAAKSDELTDLSGQAIPLVEQNSLIEEYDIPVPPEILPPKTSNQETEKAQDQYVPFGDFVIGQSSETFKNEQSEEKETVSQSKPKRNFVDLTLTDIYSQNIETKRCVNCGSENHIHATHCIICGDKFISE